MSLPPRWRLRRLLVLSSLLIFIFIYAAHWPYIAPSGLESQYPLLFKYVQNQRGHGGAWHIPHGWIEDLTTPPETIVDAAKIATERSTLTAERNIRHSAIPLIVHQTWKNTQIETWSQMMRHSAERWLEDVEETEMAYFLWDDDGVAQFVKRFEPEFEEKFHALPSDVERSDVFRVLVAKWIGGIYGDMDTEPLRNPSTWIAPGDLLKWKDPETNEMYSATGTVRAIVGLEADCPPQGDEYWRMGYAQPVQLTQWAFASAPRHPIFQRFIDRLSASLDPFLHGNGSAVQIKAPQETLQDLDPLVLTGPAAFTEVVKGWLTTTTGLRWNALSGLDDGGESKVVRDILVLPITGFSPGRGRYGNMGSKPISDPSARLFHHAQGSWRRLDIKVELGKFCRTIFGLCRDWSKASYAFGL
ncbi:hypothetical protein BDV23DRAFT_144017 [Aspergillus alliaceus]|uniref:Glycosyl transferase n=1 Tax=Petromyces alliaceus TaxID=209559 RepID=A0A5N7CQW5_PETAA|nr:hypothetical protein BDV23DRAFT_144017 [Aspergillus alliaceus]